jgi:hypothetical protein
MELPFVHLNLRFNPFGEAGLDERPSLAVVDVPALAPGDAVQFVGDCGRGKTTHLLALRAQHPGAVYERLDEGQDRCRGPVPASGLLLLDEAQRLRPALLRRLLRREGPVALGTHVDLSPAARRPIPTILLRGLDVSRLRRIVERRIAWARRGPGAVPVVPDRALQALIARHGDDLRAIEGHLYDAVQDMKEPGDVEV